MSQKPKQNKVEAIQVNAKPISQLLSDMGRTAYQGRTLAEAADIWREMIERDKLTIVLGLSGSMSTAGQWKLVNWLIENRFVDVLVSTGANVSEDIVEAMGHSYWQGSAQADDQALLSSDINRYYDVYGREQDYRAMEELLTEFITGLDAGRDYSSMEFLHRLGHWLGARDIHGITATAARHGVPIFCPAITDSAFGESLLMARNAGHAIRLDQLREFHQFVGIGQKAGDTGVIYVGGGVPKDFTQLLAISLSPWAQDREVSGRQGHLRRAVHEYYYPHRYAIQITTDSPQWGGLSGCTLDEAVSWGKIAAGGRRVTCYCDATIALPLLTHALNETVQVTRQPPDLSWLFADAG